MRIQILTPEKAVFDAESESVRVPGELGSFEVLKNHAPILSSLVPGEVRVISDKKEITFRVSKGFFEFSHNEGVVLVDTAERA
jgi:F-type H+-transporting ATPase subunit epsilon